MTAFYLSKPYEPPQAPENLPLDQPWALLGGISPEKFMKKYWHKKPLLVRGAIPAFELAKTVHEPLSSPISAKELFKIASKDDVESRLIKAHPCLQHPDYNELDQVEIQTYSQDLSPFLASG